MTEVEIENGIMYCGECGYTAKYEAVLQHFQESHGVGKDNATINGEVIVLETPPVKEVTTIAEIADAHENERNILLWTKSSTAKLIELVKEKQDQFNSPYMRKKEVWKVISEELSSKHNINASPIQCENKWKAIARKYRKHGDRTIRKLAFSNNLSKILKDRNSSQSGKQNATDTENADCLQEPEAETSCANDTVPQILDEFSMHSYSCRAEPSPSSETRQAEDFLVEPQWFKTFRMECQKRHEERMELQNKLLDQHRNLMMQLLLTISNLKD